MRLWPFSRRVAAPVREAQPDDDTGWVRGSVHGGRPLNPDRDELDGDALLQEAYKAYKENPLAYAIVEQTTSFVLGGGATVVAQDPRVQSIVDAFWHDPENSMPLRIYSLQTELSLFGEQFIRFFVDPLTGRTVIRQLDPLYIKDIETHPDDLERPLRYLYSPPRSSPLSSRERGIGGEVWLLAQDILHITINKVSSSLRGRSDLAPIIPWLRRYRRWLEDRILLNESRAAVVWDVTVAGAGKPEIERLRTQWAKPPRRGTVLFHSEAEAWKPVAHEVNAGDAAADGRAIRLMVATGALLPEHYLAEGGNANRATAAEMGLPAMMRFKRRQELLRSILTTIVSRVIAEAVRAGRLGPRVNRAILVQFEELTTSPLDHVADAVGRLSSALAIASEHGWVNQQEARRLWWRFAGQADESRPQDATLAPNA